MKTTTINCDACGAPMPPLTLDSPCEFRFASYDWRIKVGRQDLSKVKGAYRPPHRWLHICPRCMERIARIFPVGATPKEASNG